MHWSVERLLSPLHTDKFIDAYYDRNFLIIDDRAPDFYSTLASSLDIDSLLQVGELTHDDVRLIDNDDVIPYHEYTITNKQEIDIARVRRHFDNGVSMVIKSMDKRIPSLARLCADLAYTFDAKTWANVYITPPGSRALKVHYDTHNVFILQLSGKKHWELYSQYIIAPMPYQIEQITEQVLPDMAASKILAPGDLLFLPRGFSHRAQAASQTSLHITVAVEPKTWADVITRVIREAALKELELRKIPPIHPRSLEMALKSMWPTLMGILDQNRDAIIALEKQDHSKSYDKWVALMDGSIFFDKEIDCIDDEVIVFLDQGMHHRIGIHGDCVRIETSQGDVDLPIYYFPVIAKFLSGEKIQIKNIAGFATSNDRGEFIRTLLKLRNPRLLRVDSTFERKSQPNV